MSDATNSGLDPAFKRDSADAVSASRAADPYGMNATDGVSVSGLRGRSTGNTYTSADTDSKEQAGTPDDGGNSGNSGDGSDGHGGDAHAGGPSSGHTQKQDYGHAAGHPGGHPGSHAGRNFPVVRQIRHDLSKKPFIAIWEVTRACALVCKHCRAEAQKKAAPGQLTTQQGKELLRQLAGYEPPRPLVVLTGGDCFERPDLVELVQFGTDLGLSISISPSVTPKFTRERVQALRDAGGKAMSVSMDGASAQTHDAFRGIPGTFAKTLEATKIINEVGFRLQINTVLTRDNIHEAPAMLKRAIDLKAFMWYVFFLVPTGRGQALKGMTPREREDVLHWLHDVSDRIAIKTTEGPQYRRVAFQRANGEPFNPGELYQWLTEETVRILGEHPVHPRRPRTPLAINSGSGFVFIDHVGDVYPSGFLPIHVGSVKERSLPDLYENSQIMRDLRTPAKLGGKCGACEYNHFCGGSRSTAYALFHDALAADPTCLHVPKEYDGPMPEGWSDEVLPLPFPNKHPVPAK
ncbi:MAG: TIGR04053 family radical SAM/SPASM domain-containing protein [Actinomycetaceae bacterium]|nr:TIGR04053 family radical SAM/SPASM domain-containing protein [Actinomycetaceae bacterium]